MAKKKAKNNSANDVKMKTANNEQEENSKAGLFIPAGVLLGLGFGFLFNNVPAFLFLGIGIGFLVFALVKNKVKCCRR